MRRFIFTRHLCVSLILTAAAALTFLISLLSPRFADFVNFYIGGVLRAVPTTLSSLVPFSIVEIVLILALPLAILLFIWLLRHVRETHFIARSISLLLTTALLLFSSYLVTVACGYRTTPLEKRMKLPEVEITVETLDRTARALLSEANALEGEIVRGENGASIMPYSYDELSKELLNAYQRMNERYMLTPPSAARLKPVLLSDLMSSARFAGIWSYITGETNINVNPPDYCIPFTAAHEMAHQRGVARENEANFVAFLVLSSAESPYLRYAGYVGLFEYVASDLARLDRDAYRALATDGLLSEGILSEMRAYNEYYFKTEDSVISGVAGSVNDAYLKLNGTSGETSYNEVVHLALAFFCTE